MRYQADEIYNDVSLEEDYYEQIIEILLDHGFKHQQEIYTLNFEDVAMELAQYCVEHNKEPEGFVHVIYNIAHQMDDGELTCEYESGMRYIFDQEFEDK